MTQRNHGPARRRGVAMLLTLIFLAMFACLAVAIAASADMNVVVARNRINGQQAAAMAESGLQLVQKNLGGLAVPGTHNAADLHQAIAEHFEAVLSDSSMLDADDIHWSAQGVTVPPAVLVGHDNRSGAVDLNIVASGGALDDTTVTVHSTGRYGNASRTIHYNMTVQRGQSVLADYGIASKSKIEMTGNASVTGANDPSEGSVMSATYSTNQAVKLTGCCNIAGDVAVCNPSGYIQKTGIVTIGGDELIGASEPEWPEVDPSVFEPYATNPYTGSGAGNLVLSNIRIPPNTNPTFSGNVIVYGVVYVESPNKVQFTGNATLIGVIVCEPPAVDNLTANQIHFTGNLSTSGVENLPSLPEYEELRALTGSFLLAPGYSTKFTGNFNTVNGCMVASQFEFSGNAGGRIKGGVVNLRDSQFKLTGNANLVIDRASAEEHPAGLRSSFRLVCVSGSYSE